MPSFMYHHIEAPEGKLFESEAAAPAGWVDTPAKFPQPKPVKDDPPKGKKKAD